MNIGALVVDGTMWVAVPIAMLAGLVSFLSPCVLPLVPGYLGYITGAVQPRERTIARAPATAAVGTPGAGEAEAGEGAGAEASVAPARGTAVEIDTDAVPVGRGRLIGGVLLFIAGFTLVFMTLTVLGGTFGAVFVRYEDVILRVAGVLIILMGLVFVGFFGLAQRTLRPVARANIGLAGAPLLGIALGVGWAPCIGPTLTAIMTLSWSTADPSRGAVLGLAYSLGLGLPFVLIALGFGWATRSTTFLRRHIRTVNLIGGGLLIALGLLMVTGVWGTLMSYLQGVFLNVPLPL